MMHFGGPPALFICLIIWAMSVDGGPMAPKDAEQSRWEVVLLEACFETLVALGTLNAGVWTCGKILG